MRRSPALLFALLLASGAQAQNDQYIISRQGSVSITPDFESWSSSAPGLTFSQFSTILSAYVPLGRNASFSLRGGGETSGGDVAKLSGLADLQAGANYYVESISTVFSLGINAPTGKKELSHDEFLTLVLFSNPLFDLPVPSLGEGFNVNPGLAWVFPVSENVVLGIAAAYQYRGPYTPRAGLPDYAPGGEVTATVGADFRLSETAGLSTDVMFTSYGSDKYGGKEVFASGNSYWVNAQYRQSFREDELQVVMGYRTTSKGKIEGAAGLVDESERLEPGWFEAAFLYRHRFSSRFSMDYVVGTRLFEHTAAPLSGADIFSAGVNPTLSFASGFYLAARVKVQGGKLYGGRSITSIEAGVGVGWNF